MRFFLLVLLILASTNVFADGIDVRFDVASAKAILALPGTAPSEEELARIASLPGSEALIKQAALFETILFRLANDDVSANRLYNLGFSGTWDSPLYFAGYRMAQVVEKYDGRDAIRKAWSKPPVHFFQRYAALAAEHSEDPLVVPLSESAKKILAALSAPE